MMSRIIEFSVKNRFIVILLTAGLAAGGLFCLFRTPVDALPDLSENQVIVWADWPGRSPKEIEDQITYPLSVNLQGLAGIKAVRATSEFDDSSPIDNRILLGRFQSASREQVREAIAAARASMAATASG